MSQSDTLKFAVAVRAAIVAGLLTAVAWRYGYLQVLVDKQLAQPSWAAPLFGVVAGVTFTIDLWRISRCKYFAATMAAGASILLGGFFWATTQFGYWESALSLADSISPWQGPLVIAGAGAVYMFYVCLVVFIFARPARVARAHSDSQ